MRRRHKGSRHRPIVPSRVVCSGDLSLSFLCPPGISIHYGRRRAADIPTSCSTAATTALAMCPVTKLISLTSLDSSSGERNEEKFSSPPSPPPSLLSLPPHLLPLPGLSAHYCVQSCLRRGQRPAGSALPPLYLEEREEEEEEEPHRQPRPAPLSPSLRPTHAFYDKWPCQYVDQRKGQRPRWRRRRIEMEMVEGRMGGEAWLNASL